MELNPTGKDQSARLEAEVSLRLERTEIIPSARKPDNADRLALRNEPTVPPVMFQTWSNLLFLHWEWDPADIQRRLPPGLFVDTYGEKTYVAVTPFFMNNVRASFLPEIPGAANFLELNVRTYVHDANGVPGVWFFSLDCDSRLAVMMAKALYSLPYHQASMTAEERDGLVTYSCHRQGAIEAAEFHYRRESTTVGAPPGSLPFFLAERYLLYAYSQATGQLYRARIHHEPWQLFHAHLGKFDQSMLRLNDLNPKLRPPDHRWMAAPVRVKIFALEKAV